MRWSNRRRMHTTERSPHTSSERVFTRYRTYATVEDNLRSEIIFDTNREDAVARAGDGDERRTANRIGVRWRRDRSATQPYRFPDAPFERGHRTDAPVETNGADACVERHD